IQYESSKPHLLLLQRLHQQREMDFLCDITIMVRDVEFRAHRNILAAFSDYFSSQAESGDEVTTLDPEKASMWAVLTSVYGGLFCLFPSHLSSPKGEGKSEDLSVDESDTSVKDFGDDNSADWSPSQDDESPLKKPRLSFGEGRRGRDRGKGRGRGRGRGRRKNEEEEGGDNEEEEGEVGEEMGELSLFCAECNKQFKDVSSLRRHEKIHKGLKPFSCIFCSKTFRQATQLKTHLRIHTGEKPFSCTQCDKCFAQKCQLVAHRRMYHGEEKPYTCDRCGFKFATSSNYKIHLRLHSGEKPYVCDVCGQAFAQSSTLTYHKRRHTGEKPYQCDLCGMSFSVSSSLIAHARKHTGEARRYLVFLCVFVSGETPYKCSQPSCDAKFVTSSELKKHMRRLHPGEFLKTLKFVLFYRTELNTNNRQDKKMPRAHRGGSYDMRDFYYFYTIFSENTDFKYIKIQTKSIYTFTTCLVYRAILYIDSSYCLPRFICFFKYIYIVVILI
uniref:Myoneurin n=1 Tax=Amphiprion percula TaxID=161767 RepID=A0A3P8S3H1_AMPPE